MGCGHGVGEGTSQLRPVERDSQEVLSSERQRQLTAGDWHLPTRAQCLI